MKKILKYVLWIFIAIIILIDIVLTVYLLNYNQYNVAEFGDKSILIMDKKIDKFEKGDLLIVKKNENKEFKVGDNVFFYDTVSKETIVNFGKINEVNDNKEKENTFIMSNDYLLSDESIIGKADTAKVYSKWGSIIGFITSRWVFLIFVIIPILVLFLYQLYLLILEIKKARNA